MRHKKISLPKKPFKKRLTDSIDYYNLFDVIESKYENCYMLESLQLPRHQDRYFTIGFDPAVVISARGNIITFEGSLDKIRLIFPEAQEPIVRLEVENPYYFLREIFPNDLIGKNKEGGLIGYFSYESVNYFEPALDLPEDNDFGQFRLGLYLDGLIYDMVTGITEYYCYTEDRSLLVEDLLKEMDYVRLMKKEEKLNKVVCLGDTLTEEEHKKAVINSLKEIELGNTFQTEVGFKTVYQIEGRKKLIYDKLREINPSPYMFYVKFSDYTLFGASPEILISSNNGEVLTSPAAGTIKRGSDEVEDMTLARQLLTDPKEIAEHNMLVDLHRNDLGKVSQVGSVRIRDLMYIIKFSHVQHIVSDIVGILNDDKDAFDVLAAILPGGVLTGTPKIETIKIIAENEKVPRGPYGGAVGRFSFNGDCAFALPIRSVFCKGDKCFTQTSSGVVLDSTPEREYDEVKRKLEATRFTLESLTN